MAIFSPSLRQRAVPRAVALLLAACGAAHAQTTLRPVVITGQASPPVADVTGFGDVPLKDVPASATVIDRKQIEAAGARRLADLTRFDASVTDAYNAPGYWDFLSIRGFTLDNRFNYRREGLPITAETSIPLENKERVEILKGTSGIQAGTSAPGGLVNYVVKRPTGSDLREVRLEYTQRSSILAAVDLGGRFGTDATFGYRLNAAQERLRPLLHNLDGERSLLALATDWRISRDALLEAEVEWSNKRQPSQVGFSLVGNVLPAVPKLRLNLNNQAWVQPTEFGATTGTIRYTQAIARDWKLSVQWGTQRLKTDDFTAFPFGCSAEGNYDRYCSNGTFDYYDYRSENERRRQDVAALSLKGKATLGGATHDLSFGATHTKVRDRLPPNAYNWVGVGNIDGSALVPADPTLSYAGTNRDERSLELSAQDVIRWGERWSAWLGLRHTRLDRASIATDGTGATSYRQSLTTPWAAVSYQFGHDTTAYASWGQGVESQVVPDNGLYSNPGVTLPSLKSRQWEIGLKGTHESLAWQVAAFDIHRPMSNIDYCNGKYLSCTGQFDGYAVHRGLEASTQWTRGPLKLGGSVMLLDAKRHGSTIDPSLNGKQPQNVPATVARLNAAWKVAGVPGLELLGNVIHEGRRAVLADESVMLPAWSRVDASLRYETRLAGALMTWTLGFDNLTDRRYWKEAPYKFGHVYLYAGAPRTLRLTLSAAL